MEAKTMKDILLNLRNRFFGLVDKLFFSMKGVGFIIATILAMMGIIPWYGWGLVWIGTVSWRLLERIINKIVDSKASELLTGGK